MPNSALDLLNATIRDVVDFPKPGILFKDITPVLANAETLRLAMDEMEKLVGGRKVDKVLGIDARGFIFGALLAARLNCGFILARKKGKLPWKTRSVDYSLEYGTAQLEMHEDAVLPGENILLADDLLATGGTSAAALKLVQEMQGNVVGSLFFIELAFLKGRSRVDDFGPVHSVITY